MIPFLSWRPTQLKHGSMAIASLVLCLSLGCAKQEPAPTTTPLEDASTTPQNEVTSSPFNSENLMGIWLGNATIDSEKLQRKLNQLDAAERQLAEAKARSFLSTVMAVEYKHDGTLENELELMSIDGQQLRDGSIGSWHVVETKEDGLVIETQERLSDGSLATGRSYFKFFDNGTRFVAAVPLSEELEDCDAKLVFERQMLPAANLAAGQSDTQNK